MASETTAAGRAESSAGAPTRYVRHEVSTPEGQKALAAYATAVAAMKARADDDPTSWFYQAAMHGTYEKSLQKLWNGCKHYSWYFLPWHRMFVYHFERIARDALVKAGGPATWALPYWNYGLGGAHASIPEAFRAPNANGGENPLYVQKRAPRINDGAPLPREAITPRLALARPEFVGGVEFGGGKAPATPQFWEEAGALEETPHNIVHDKLGGPGGLMSDPDLAAQDPIFWLHHSQIDRLWARWNAEGHANPTEPEWNNQSFAFFDANGALVAKTCSQVDDTVADLGYEYDDLTK